MTSLRIFIIKFFLFLGQRTFIGRGKLRALIIKIIRIITFKNSIENHIQKDFAVSILGVPFVFFIDKAIGYKIYFCRSERKEIFFVKKKYNR
jgi:hypothetical protein